MQRAPKTIVYHLIDSVEIKTKEEGMIKLTWGTCDLDARYMTRDAFGVGTIKVIHTSTTHHPKSGVEIPVPINGVRFVEGKLRCVEGRDNHIIEALDNSVNNIGFANRLDDDKAIFCRLDEVAERLSKVDKIQLAADAFAAVDRASVETVLEFAKAIGGIDTFAVDILLKKAKGNTDKVKGTDEFKNLAKELKSFAHKDPEDFMKRFEDESRPYLASINEGLTLKAMRYKGAERQFVWVIGNSEHPFIRVPKGIVDEKDWLAGWFQIADNESTYRELLEKIQATK